MWLCAISFYLHFFWCQNDKCPNIRLRTYNNCKFCEICDFKFWPEIYEKFTGGNRSGCNSCSGVGFMPVLWIIQCVVGVVSLPDGNNAIGTKIPEKNQVRNVSHFHTKLTDTFCKIVICLYSPAPAHVVVCLPFLGSGLLLGRLPGWESRTRLAR